MAKSPRKSRKPKTLDTLTAFAAALNTPITTVSGWTRHARWQWATKAPWPASCVPDVLRWAADALEKGRPAKDAAAVAAAATANPITKVVSLRDEKLEQEIRKLRAHADQAETALAKERGKLHDADACEEEAVRRATLFRNGVQNVPLQVVSLALSRGMPNEAAPEFQKQVEELVNACLRYLADPAGAAAAHAAADAEPAPGDDPSAVGTEPA